MHKPGGNGCGFRYFPIRTTLVAVLVGLLLAAGFAYAQLDIVTKSLQFDLTRIGQSIYEAHRDHGKWPARIEDLEGTAYLAMPYRRRLLEQQQAD